MLFILLFQGKVGTWSAPHCCAGLQQPRLQGVPHCRGDGLGCPQVVAVGALQAESQPSPWRCQGSWGPSGAALWALWSGLQCQEHLFPPLTVSHSPRQDPAHVHREPSPWYHKNSAWSHPKAELYREGVTHVIRAGQCVSALFPAWGQAGAGLTVLGRVLQAGAPQCHSSCMCSLGRRGCRGAVGRVPFQSPQPGRCLLRPFAAVKLIVIPWNPFFTLS